MSTDESFLTVVNIRNLLQIFESFLRDKYSFENDNEKLNIKQLIYETMIKVSAQNKDTQITLGQLNKVTLSIVKNITKEKLHLDKRFNGALTRDRDISKNNTSPSNTNLFNRPVQSMSDDNKKSMMQEYDSLVQDRDFEKSMPTIPKSINSSSIDTIDPDAFMQKLGHLKQHRVSNDASDLFAAANRPDPKHFFASQMDQPKSEPESYNTVHIENGLQPDSMYSATKPIDAIESENIGKMIQPSTHKIPHEMRTAYIVIDSRNRDTKKYPNPNDYVIEFDSPIKNIESVELTYALYDSVIKT